MPLGGRNGPAGTFNVAADLDDPRDADARSAIDRIGGTSMGAIVGAAYASGSTVPEMEALLSSLSTRILFKELPPREERSSSTAEIVGAGSSVGDEVPQGQPRSGVVGSAMVACRIDSNYG